MPENVFELEITTVVDRKVLGKIIDKCIKIHGTTETAIVLIKSKPSGSNIQPEVP